MARKPKAQPVESWGDRLNANLEAIIEPVEPQERVPAPNPNLVTNNTPGSRLWLSGGRWLAYGESGICEETATLLRTRANG